MFYVCFGKINGPIQPLHSIIFEIGLHEHHFWDILGEKSSNIEIIDGKITVCLYPTLSFSSHGNVHHIPSFEKSILFLQLMIRNFQCDALNVLPFLPSEHPGSCGIILKHKILQSFLGIFWGDLCDFPSTQYQSVNETSLECALRAFHTRTGIKLQVDRVHTPTILLQNKLFYLFEIEDQGQRNLCNHEPLCDVGWMTQEYLRFQKISTVVKDFFQDLPIIYGRAFMLEKTSLLQIITPLSSNKPSFIKVVTWNVLFEEDSACKWKQISKNIDQWMMEKRIIFLQEITPDRKEKTLGPLCTTRNCKLFYVSCGTKITHFIGNAVLLPSCFEIINAEYIRMGDYVSDFGPAKWGQQRLVYLSVEEKAYKNRFSVVCIHLSHHRNDDYYLNQCTIIQDIIQKRTPFPVLLAGDFNFEPSQPAYDNMIKQYGSLWQNFPVEPTAYQRQLGIQKCIDYIFWSPCDWSLQKFSIEDHLKSNQKLPSPHFPSDHLFLCADFHKKAQTEYHYSMRQIKCWRDDYISSLDAGAIVTEIRMLFHKHEELQHLDYKIKYRYKHEESIHTKCMLVDISFFELTDILGISIILRHEDMEMCYKVIDLLKTCFPDNLDRSVFDDYIKNPQNTNFQGLSHIFWKKENAFEIFVFLDGMYTFNRIWNRLEYNDACGKKASPETVLYCFSQKDWLHPLDHILKERGISLYTQFGIGGSSGLPLRYAYYRTDFLGPNQWQETDLLPLDIPCNILNREDPQWKAIAKYAFRQICGLSNLLISIFLKPQKGCAQISIITDPWTHHEEMKIKNDNPGTLFRTALHQAKKQIIANAYELYYSDDKM